jgi:hypothetical protein
MEHSLAAILALTLFAAPNVGWSTRVPGRLVTGQVTSTPTSGQIEVDHRLYRVKAGTAADKNLHKFHLSQMVDLELDAPVATKSNEVVSIAAHVGPMRTQ